MITAAALRAVGVALPDDIPDEAVVPREAVRSRMVQCSPLPSSAVLASFVLEFTAPFEWHDEEDTIH